MITVLGFINPGVLVTTHRGYRIINGDQFAGDRGFYCLRPVVKGVYQIERYIALG